MKIGSSKSQKLNKPLTAAVFVRASISLKPCRIVPAGAIPQSFRHLIYNYFCQNFKIKFNKILE